MKNTSDDKLIFQNTASNLEMTKKNQYNLKVIINLWKMYLVMFWGYNIFLLSRILSEHCRFPVYIRDL